MRSLNRSFRIDRHETSINSQLFQTTSQEEKNEFFGQQKPLDEHEKDTFIPPYGHYVPVDFILKPDITAEQFDSAPGKSLTIGNFEYKVYNNPENGQKEVYRKSANDTISLFTPNADNTYIIAGERYTIDEDNMLAKKLSGEWPDDSKQKGINYNGSVYKAIGGNVYRNHNGTITQYSAAADGSNTYVIDNKPYIIRNNELQPTISKEEFENAGDTGVTQGGATYKAINGQIYKNDGKSILLVPTTDGAITIGDANYSIDPESGFLLKVDSPNTTNVIEKWSAITNGIENLGIVYKVLFIDGKAEVYQQPKDGSAPITKFEPNKGRDTYVIGGASYKIEGKAEKALLVEVSPTKQSDRTIDINTGLVAKGGLPDEKDMTGAQFGVNVNGSSFNLEASATTDFVDTVDLEKLFFDYSGDIFSVGGGIKDFFTRPSLSPQLLQLPSEEQIGVTGDFTLGNLTGQASVGLNSLDSLNGFFTGGQILYNLNLGEAGSLEFGPDVKYTNDNDRQISTIEAGASVRYTKELRDYFSLSAFLRGYFYNATLNNGIIGAVPEMLPTGALQWNADGTPIWNDPNSAPVEVEYNSGDKYFKPATNKWGEIIYTDASGNPLPTDDSGMLAAGVYKETNYSKQIYAGHPCYVQGKGDPQYEPYYIQERTGGQQRALEATGKLLTETGKIPDYIRGGGINAGLEFVGKGLPIGKRATADFGAGLYFNGFWGAYNSGFDMQGNENKYSEFTSDVYGSLFGRLNFLTPSERFNPYLLLQALGGVRNGADWYGKIFIGGGISIESK